MGEGFRVQEETKNQGRGGEVTKYHDILKLAVIDVISLDTFLRAFVYLIRCMNDHYSSSLTQNEEFNSGFVEIPSMDEICIGPQIWGNSFLVNL